MGDLIVYYDPRRSTGDLGSSGGRQVYFATARIDRIIADPVLADHFYAEISNYLPFTRPVPFKEGAHCYERGLLKKDGSTNKGALERAVQNLPEAEYDLIWQAGFGHFIGWRSAVANRQTFPKNQFNHLHGLRKNGWTLDMTCRWSRIAKSWSN